MTLLWPGGDRFCVAYVFSLKLSLTLSFACLCCAISVERCKKWQEHGEVEILSSHEVLEGFCLYTSFQWASQGHPVWTLFEETGKSTDIVHVSRIKLSSDHLDSAIASFLTTSNFLWSDTKHGRVLLAPLPPVAKVTTKRSHHHTASKQTDYRIPIPNGDFDSAESLISAELSLVANYHHLSPAGGFVSLDTVAVQLTKDAFCSTFQLSVDESESLADVVISFQSRIQSALIALALIKLKKSDGNLDATCMTALRQFQLDFNTKHEDIRRASLAEYLKLSPEDAPSPSDPHHNSMSPSDPTSPPPSLVMSSSSQPSTGALHLRMEGLLDFKTITALFGYIAELKEMLEGVGFQTPSDPLKVPKRFRSIFKAIRGAMDENELGEAMMSATALPVGGLPPLSSIPRFFEHYGHAHRQSIEYGKMVPPNLKSTLTRITAAAAKFKPKEKKKKRKSTGSNSSPSKHSHSHSTSSKRKSMQVTHESPYEGGSSSSPSLLSDPTHSPPRFAENPLATSPQEEASPSPTNSSPRGTPRTKGLAMITSNTNAPESPRRSVTSPTLPRKSSIPPEPSTASPRTEAELAAKLGSIAEATAKEQETLRQDLLNDPSAVLLVFDREYHQSVAQWDSQIEIVDQEVVLQGYKLWIDPSHVLSRSQPGWALTKGDASDMVVAMAIKKKSRVSSLNPLWEYFSRARENSPNVFTIANIPQGHIIIDLLSTQQSEENKLVRAHSGKLNPHISRIRILATLQRLGCTAKDFEFSLLHPNIRSQDQFYLKYKMDREVPIDDALYHIVRNVQLCLIAISCMELDQMSPWYSNFVEESVKTFEDQMERANNEFGGKKLVTADGRMNFLIYDELVNQTRIFNSTLSKFGFPVKCTPFEDNLLFASYTTAFVDAQKLTPEAFKGPDTKPLASPRNAHRIPYPPLLARYIPQDAIKQLVINMNKLLVPPPSLLPITLPTTVTTTDATAPLSPTSSKHPAQASAPLTPTSANNNSLTATPSPSTSNRPQNSRLSPRAIISKDDSSIRSDTSPSHFHQEIEFGSSLATKYKEVLKQHEDLQEKYQTLEDTFIELSNDAAEANTSLQFFEEQYKESVQNYDSLTKEYEAMRRASDDREASIQALVQNVATLETKLQKLARISQRSFTTQLLWYIILLVLYILLLPAIGVAFLIDLWKHKKNGLVLTEDNSLRARLQRYARHQLTKLERVIDELESKVNKMVGMEQTEKPN